MDRREEARKYFENLKLSYGDITMLDIYKLIQILNNKISNAQSCMIMINEPKINGKNKNVIFKNDKLVFAEIRVKGTYFDDREAITFNEDGFVGISGWADGYNLTPFVIGFKEWCNYLKSKKININIDPLKHFEATIDTGSITKLGGI